MEWREDKRSLTIVIIVEDQIMFSPGNFKWSLSLWYTQGSEKKMTRQIVRNQCPGSNTLAN